MPRSMDGSLRNIPPVTFKYTSWADKLKLHLFSRTAMIKARRFWSIPEAMRRGYPAPAAETSACISINSGRVPSKLAVTAVPG